MAKPEEEVNRLTENVYKFIGDNFNPNLRNLITVGKNYEKSLYGVTQSAKGYFDALVKMGELAGNSQGSKEMSDTIFQIAEVHRQVQYLMDDALKSFRIDILINAEQKLEADGKFVPNAQKKHQLLYKEKSDAVAKPIAELKKLHRKSHSSRNPNKYEDKASQILDQIDTQQKDLNSFLVEGYKQAVLEERKRFCSFVDRQCEIIGKVSSYHEKANFIMQQKVTPWKETAGSYANIPDATMTRVKAIMGTVATVNRLPEKGSGSNSWISAPIPTTTAFPLPPELAAFKRQANQQPIKVKNLPTNLPGSTSDYRTVSGRSVPPKQVSDAYACTLPSRRLQSPATDGHSVQPENNGMLPRTTSMASGLDHSGSQKSRVKAIFGHSAGRDPTLLSFDAGDVITLLVPSSRDGWHYGANHGTNMKGWFPFSYTRPLDDAPSRNGSASIEDPGGPLARSASTGNLMDTEAPTLPPPDYENNSARLRLPNVSNGTSSRAVEPGRGNNAVAPFLLSPSTDGDLPSARF
uniref:BAR/IMD domain-containing adapter protein 2 isoform X2 n=1 Tax=Myxine glutinosa TaxID=7769 RepID=UPI00358F558B